jgi:glutamate--cysteine ligase
LWDDWELHLSTIFTNVRFEPFLEFRGVDCPRPDLVMSVPALLKGILYDGEAREAAWSLVKSWSFLELRMLYEQVGREGPRSRIGGHALIDIFPELVRISREGLRRQALKNEQGEDETKYLESLEALLERGSGCPASQVIASWEGEWNRDIRKLIEYCRF